MYRRAMPLIVAMVGLCACAALPDTLSVDFGVSDSPVAGPSANDVENGFFDFSVPSDEINNVPPVANTIVSSLGTGGTVRVTVSGVTQGCFWRDRDVEKTGTLGDLAEEFAACGTDLALTLSDLRAGFYTMTTYHHDQVYTTPAWPADTSVGIDMIVVASGGGTSTVVTDDVVSAGQAEPPTSVTFQFSANGVDDVVVTFKDRVGGNPVLNGFELYARNVVIDDGDAGNIVFAHEGMGSADHVTGTESHRIKDDAIFATFDQFYLAGLLLDGEILVNDADAALLGQGDGQGGLGDGIHGRTDQGDVDGNVARQLCAGVGFAG